MTSITNFDYQKASDDSSRYNHAMSSSGTFKAILIGMIFLTLSVVFFLQPNILPVSRVSPEKAETPAEKIKELESMLVWNLENAEIHEQLGILYDADKKFEEAIIHLLPGYQSHRLGTVGLFALGNAYYNSALYDQAFAVWSEIKPGNDQALEARDNLLGIYIDQDQVQQASRIMVEWYKQSGEPRDGLNAAGLLLEDDPLRALVILRQLNTPDSRMIIPLAEKIQPFMQKPDGQDVWLPLASGFRQARAYFAAEAAIKHVLQNSTDQKQYAWMEYALIKEATDRDGSKELAMGLKTGAEDIVVNMKAAEFWMGRVKPEIALVYLEQAHLLSPRDSAVLRALGEAKLSVGLGNEGLYDLMQAADIAQTDANQWLRIGKYTLEHHDQMNTIGIQAIRKAVVLQPEDPIGYDLLGQIYLIEGDLINAEKMLLKAVDLSPNNVDISIHYAMLLIEKGDKPAARNVLEKTLSISHDAAQKRTIVNLLASVQ